MISYIITTKVWTEVDHPEILSVFRRAGGTEEQRAARAKEYAAGTLLLARPSWSLSVGLALLGAAAVLLLAVLGYLGVRIGIHATLASWATYPLLWLRGALRLEDAG